MAVGVNGATGSVVTLAKTRALAVNPVKQQNGRSTPFDIGVDPLLRGRGCPVVAEPFSPLLDVERPSLQAAQLVAVAHNGLFACVVGQWDHALRIVSTQTGATLATIATGQDDLSCVAISRDDTTVVMGSLDNSVVLLTPFCRRKSSATSCASPVYEFTPMISLMSAISAALAYEER